MAIAKSLKAYLEKKRIPYDVHTLAPFTSLVQAASAAGINPNALVKGVALKDDLGYVLVVLPATYSLNVPGLSKMLNRKLVLATEQDLKTAFKDCETQFLPPFGDIYSIRTIVDDSLLSADIIYFPTGDASNIISVGHKHFYNLLGNAWLGSNYAFLTEGRAGKQAGAKDAVKTMPAVNLKERIEQLDDLPSMPEMSRRIIQVSVDPFADARKLSEVVELDPSLSAQIIRYAKSSLYAYQGEVDSVHTAISRVLGYDAVINIALGIATAKPFKIPQMGPIGLRAFWKHAVYSAALVQALGKEISGSVRPQAGLSYLAGLLHNFGHLLLGHLFKREFFMLTNLITENPKIPIIELEVRAIGVDHGYLGGWLMEAWGMPNELVVAVREHHNVAYNGPHAHYSRLVLIADRLLKGHDLGDAATTELPPEVLKAVGLDQVKVLTVMNRLLENCESLNNMAEQMSE